MVYKGIKFPPLTPKEIEERYAEAKDELEAVLEWKFEEEKKLDNEELSPQAKGAAKRALKKVERRLATVKGNILYWKLRVEGQSHFRANLERAEFWDKAKNGEGED